MQKKESSIKIFDLPSNQTSRKASPTVYYFPFATRKRLSQNREREREEMSDWAPVFVAVVLFLLLTPGLLIQVPGRNRFIEFGNFQTCGVSILVHAILYFALLCILLLAVGIHVYIGLIRLWYMVFSSTVIGIWFRFSSYKYPHPLEKIITKPPFRFSLITEQSIDAFL